MAQEILNKIREAEDKAQEIVNTAGIAARELIREANTKADGIISANAMQIKANTAEILETAEKEAVDEFEALKEKSKYAVWVNGKVVDNTVLDNYKYTDFARYSNSHVYQNARSKRFPQENQAHLETKKYFNYIFRNIIFITF